MTLLQRHSASLPKQLGLTILAICIGLAGITPTASALEQPAPHDLRGMELFNELNRIRGDYHLAPLAVNQALGTSAQRKCADMVEYGYYGHVNPKTQQRGLALMRQEMPDGPIGEILNIGPPDTAQYYFASWMNSPGHRKIILDPQYTQVGFAICKASHRPNRIMLVGHFGTLPPPPPSPAP